MRANTDDTLTMADDISPATLAPERCVRCWCFSSSNLLILRSDLLPTCTPETNQVEASAHSLHVVLWLLEVEVGRPARQHLPPLVPQQAHRLAAQQQAHIRLKGKGHVHSYMPCANLFQKTSPR